MSHYVLKNGKRMPGTKGTLFEVIMKIRRLESGMCRLTEHSPYTIGKLDAPAKMALRLDLPD